METKRERIRQSFEIKRSVIVRHGATHLQGKNGRTDGVVSIIPVLNGEM